MISLPGVCLSAILGFLPLLWLAELPESQGVIFCLLAALACLSCRKNIIYYPSITLLCLSWGLFTAKESLWPLSQLTQKPVTAQVVLTRSDGVQRHELQLVSHAGRYLFPRPGVVVRDARLAQQVCAGQLWQMTLRLRPVHGQLNEGGFDSQRYALASNQALRGSVIAAKPLTTQCGIRAQLLTNMREKTQLLPTQSTILALAFGERTELNEQIKTLLRETGTAHLMAISGMHISLAAGVGWLVARLMQLFLPASRIGFRLPLLVSLATAGIYTWLAGANPPAMRALLGLTIWLVLRLYARRWSGWQVWLCCVAGILLFDPLAVLSESFWLSVLAVAVLLFWYQWMPLPAAIHSLTWAWRYPLTLIHLQIGITLLLMPVQIAIFHGISLSALVANLVAVPLVSLAVIPLLLAGMVLINVPWLGITILGWVDTLLNGLFYLLSLLPSGWLDLHRELIPLSLLGWIGVFIYRLSLWQFALPSIIATLLTLAITAMRPEKHTPGWQISMLDVGHGLAVAIVRNGKAILYDTGGAWPGGDVGERVIIPWLRWHQLTPEAIIISHEHLDHRGGLPSLQRQWPGIPVRSALRGENHLPCVEGERWQWQGLSFTVHWPPKGQRIVGNNGSCVIMVTDGKFRILLTGDVEMFAEHALVKNSREVLQANIIQVPHHGSRTSSTLPLILSVSGAAALASASRFNAWRLPSSKVVRRYKKHGYQWHDTAHSGQITIHIEGDQWKITGFREQIIPRWYHQWFGVNRDNG